MGAEPKELDTATHAHALSAGSSVRSRCAVLNGSNLVPQQTKTSLVRTQGA
jgi:hypothetical protein